MKKSLKKYLALCTFVFITLLACQKEEQAFDENSSAVQVTQKNNRETSEKIKRALHEYKGREVEANFIGRIIDQNDQPIVGANVTLGNQQETADANGIVMFTNVIVNENFAYAQASASGYVNGSRVMVPSDNNTFTIKLFHLEAAQYVDESGGEVNIRTEHDTEASIHFGGGFVDENGDPYHGSVAVIANYLDPLSEDTADTMPGELYGIDSSFQEVALGSYGMLSVELRGSSNETLQITSPATIRIPIHPSQVGTAAPQVPMWSFNEDAGVWVEEGTANNTGMYYEAQVNHFSFWNCDAPFPVVNFDATVVQAGTSIPLSNMRVRITYGSFVRYGVTNSSGVVSGKIPSNQTMILEVLDPCGSVILTLNPFGPYTGATSIIIPVTLGTAPINVSGSVTNCASAPVTNGYVSYENTSGQFLGIYQVTAGIHNYTSPVCTTPITIVMDGIDNATGQIIPTTTAVANPSVTANLVACGGLPPEYIRYSINAGPLQYDIINPGGGIQPPSFIGIGAQSPTSGTYIYGNTTTLGVYPYDNTLSIPSFAFEALGDVNGIDSPATTTVAGAIQFTVTAVSPVIGGYIDISFTGNYVDRFGTTKTITGDAHILRDY